MNITSKQRRHLRALAHHLNPVVQVGGHGVSSAVIDKTRVELENHELIKVKIGDGPMGAKEAGPLLATGTEAALVQVIGRVVVLYRPREEDPEIILPKA